MRIRKTAVTAVMLAVLAVTVVVMSFAGGVSVNLIDRAYASVTGAGSPVAVVNSLHLGPAPAVRAPAVSYARPAEIPVIVYHEIDNRCTAVVVQCNAKDVESVSEEQLAQQLAWLYSQGYHTVSARQYAAWAEHQKIALPSKPLLLTDDNGIGNFLLYAQPLLQRYGFTMVAFIVTGFADGAAGNCGTAAHSVVVTNPGCPRLNENWDLTWPQLQALAGTYTFGLEAGSSGHYVQTRFSSSCQVFYACLEPGETDTAYKARVIREQRAGMAELTRELPGRVSTQMWTVPYSDLGYPQCPQSSCTPQPSDGPPGWLVSYAAASYPVVFVEDAVRNGVSNEHFRFDAQGWMTLSYFKGALTADLGAGDFRDQGA
jgi:hypothetical protein